MALHMATERELRRYRRWYAGLLRCYPKPYNARFGEGMAQTFNDVLRARAEAGKGMFGCVLWMFAETSVEIVRENMRSSFARRRGVIRILLVAAIPLLVPLIAMQFTDEVVWDITDFVVAWVLLAGAGLTYKLLAGKVTGTGNIAHRAAIGLAVAASLILVWTNGAVGLIGSESNPANLLYGGVLVVGFIGAAAARLHPLGMAHTLFAMAAAQALVPVIAWAIWEPPVAAGMLGVFVVNVFFVALFVGSALLFRRAARAPA